MKKPCDQTESQAPIKSNQLAELIEEGSTARSWSGPHYHGSAGDFKALSALNRPGKITADGLFLPVTEEQAPLGAEGGLAPECP